MVLMHPTLQNWLDTSVQGELSEDNVLRDLGELLMRFDYHQMHLIEEGHPIERNPNGEWVFKNGLRYSLEYTNGQCLDLAVKVHRLAHLKYGSQMPLCLKVSMGRERNYFPGVHARHAFLMAFQDENRKTEGSWVVCPALKALRPYPGSTFIGSGLLPEARIPQGVQDLPVPNVGFTPLVMLENRTLITFGIHRCGGLLFQTVRSFVDDDSLTFPEKKRLWDEERSLMSEPLTTSSFLMQDLLRDEPEVQSAIKALQAKLDEQRGGLRRP